VLEKTAKPEHDVGKCGEISRLHRRLAKRSGGGFSTRG
jgi:hypothetical protein